MEMMEIFTAFFKGLNILDYVQDLPGPPQKTEPPPPCVRQPSEKTIKKLAKNAPKLKCLILQGSIDFTSEITHEFIFKMMKNEDLVIIVESLFDDDRMAVYEESIKDFLERKGSISYKKYQSVRLEHSMQWWKRYYTKDPEYFS